MTTPDLLEAFGQSAAKTSTSEDPERGNWLAMLAHQQEALKDPAKAEAYNKYLAKFDIYKDWSLYLKAFAVNHAVLTDIEYTFDKDQYHEDDYWASPVETIMSGKGDCEDFAILQKEVLLHLGVPEEKMFIALVNRAGDTQPDHAVLLLNGAEEGQPPFYYVLNDIRPVVVADNAAISKIWRTPAGKNATYVLIDARNNEGFWTTGAKYEASGVPPPSKPLKSANSAP
jgi:predicted transglutaminase-like cysteine proteinase